MIILFKLLRDVPVSAILNNLKSDCRGAEHVTKPLCQGLHMIVHHMADDFRIPPVVVNL